MAFSTPCLQTLVLMASEFVVQFCISAPNSGTKCHCPTCASSVPHFSCHARSRITAQGNATGSSQSKLDHSFKSERLICSFPEPHYSIAYSTAIHDAHKTPKPYQFFSGHFKLATASTSRLLVTNCLHDYSREQIIFAWAPTTECGYAWDVLDEVLI